MAPKSQRRKTYLTLAEFASQNQLPETEVKVLVKSGMLPVTSRGNDVIITRANYRLALSRWNPLLSKNMVKTIVRRDFGLEPKIAIN